MLKFRKHFAEASEEEQNQRFELVRQQFQDVKNVRLNADYFEDENGQPITTYEMIQHVSGQEYPIIVGNPLSVMKLGPVAPRCPETWTSTKAAVVAHFLDVVGRISSSSWYRTPQSITFLSTSSNRLTGNSQTESSLLEAIYPNDEQTTAVLAYFRQLHGGDKLLSRAVDVYIAHCGDGRKSWWVDERRGQFEALVDSEPLPFQVGFTRREIIRMFMYGAGLLHASSNQGDDEKLAGLIAGQGRHNAVAIFNHSLYDLLTIAAQVFQVIRQDYECWICDHSLEGPGRDDIRTLFKSKTE
jgi:hypothetical protein